MQKTLNINLPYQLSQLRSLGWRGSSFNASSSGNSPDEMSIRSLHRVILGIQVADITGQLALLRPAAAATFATTEVTEDGRGEGGVTHDAVGSTVFPVIE